MEPHKFKVGDVVVNINNNLKFKILEPYGAYGGNAYRCKSLRSRDERIFYVMESALKLATKLEQAVL